MSSGEDARVEEGTFDPRLTNDPNRIPKPVRYSATEISEKPDPRPSKNPDDGQTKGTFDPRLTNDPDRIPKPVRYSAAEIPEKPDPKPSKKPDDARIKDQGEKPDYRLTNDPDRLPKPKRYSAAEIKPKTSSLKLSNDTEETSLMAHKPTRYSAADPVELPTEVGDSFLAKCKNIKSESTSFPGFVFGLLAFVTASIFATVLLVISLAIPIAMLVIGIHYKDDCSGDDMIPIYLIVAGAVGIAKDVVNILDRCRRPLTEANTRSNNMERLFNLFLFAWLIAGCVFVYRIYDDVQHDNPNQDDYCDHTVYWFAFWINTISLGLIGIGFLTFCLFTCWVMN